MLAGLPWPVFLQQLGQMGMTMRCERPHTEIIGQREGLSVVALPFADIAWLTPRSDFTKQTHTPCLMASLFLASGKSQALVCVV